MNKIICESTTKLCPNVIKNFSYIAENKISLLEPV